MVRRVLTYSFSLRGRAIKSLRINTFYHSLQLNPITPYARVVDFWSMLLYFLEKMQWACIFSCWVSSAEHSRHVNPVPRCVGYSGSTSGLCSWTYLELAVRVLCPLVTVSLGHLFQSWLKWPCLSHCLPEAISPLANTESSGWPPSICSIV